MTLQRLSGILPFAKRKVILLLLVILIVFGFLIFAAHVKLSRTAQYAYKIIAEDLKKQGDEALKKGSYVVAKRLFERSMMFAEKANIPSLKQQIKKNMENDENMKKVLRGLVPFQGSWVSKEEFLKTYSKAKDAKLELHSLISRASVAGAEGDYVRAVSYYGDAIKKYDEASWLIGNEYNRDQLLKGYERALILSSKQKADIDFKNGLFDQAANVYVNILSKVDELHITDEFLLQEIHRKSVEAFINASKVKFEIKDWQSAIELIGKAKEQLHHYNYISPETVAVFDQEIAKLLGKIYTEALNGCVEIIQDMVTRIDASRTCIMAERVDDILKNIMPGGKYGTSNISCIPSRRYEIAEILLRKALNVLESASNTYNLGGLKESKALLQQTLNLVQEKAAKDRIARESFSMKLASLEEEAKKMMNSGRYEEAFRIYEECVKLIRSSSFRAEEQYQKKLEDFLNSQREITVKARSSNLERMLETMEHLVAEGKIEEVGNVVSNLNYTDIDSSNPRLRRIFWLRYISQNVRDFFKGSIKEEAVKFFGKGHQGDVNIKVDDVSLSKITVSNYKPGNACIDIRISGSVVLFVESNRKFSATPFQCEAYIKTCEGSSSVSYNGAKCREVKVKASLGPEPTVFGDLK